jgi:hypothetical protein
MRTVVVTEHDKEPRAVELMEHVCAPAVPNAMTVHAVALTTARIARNGDMVMAPGRFLQRDPTGRRVTPQSKYRRDVAPS